MILRILVLAVMAVSVSAHAQPGNRGTQKKDTCISTGVELETKPAFKAALKNTNPFVPWSALVEVIHPETKEKKTLAVRINPQEDGNALVKIGPDSPENKPRSVPFNLCMDASKTLYVSVFQYTLHFVDDKFDRLKTIDPTDPEKKREIIISKGAK